MAWLSPCNAPQMIGFLDLLSSYTLIAKPSFCSSCGPCKMVSTMYCPGNLHCYSPWHQLIAKLWKHPSERSYS